MGLFGRVFACVFFALFVFAFMSWPFLAYLGLYYLGISVFFFSGPIQNAVPSCLHDICEDWDARKIISLPHVVIWA